MSASLKHIPSGYQSVTPSLTVRNAAEALKFYEKAFDAVINYKLTDPRTGGTAHAELRIGNSTLMISDEYPDLGFTAPEVGKGGSFMIYVPDIEAAFEQAIEAGATEVQPPEDQFWGDRTARVTDAFGYRWTLSQKIRDVPEEEIARLAADWQG